MKGGAVLTKILGSTGAKPEELAALMDYSARHVRRLAQQPTMSVKTAHAIADALKIPRAEFVAAVEGRAELPRRYLDPKRWNTDDLRGRALQLLGDKGEGESDKVWRWFRDAPEAVRLAIVGRVPANMEKAFAAQVAEYTESWIRQQRVGTNGKAK